MKTVTYILIGLNFISCALFEHRDYSDMMLVQQYNEPMFSANDDFQTVNGDTGINYRTYDELVSRAPATKQQKYANQYEQSLYDELAYLETNLTEPERDFYELYKSSLGGVSEKIYFLSLAPRERREFLRWNQMQSKGNVRYQSISTRQAARSIAGYDSPLGQTSVGLGMSMSEVQNLWGSPSLRETAGDPSEANERWFYPSKNKYLYFEQGSVAGWSSN